MNPTALVRVQGTAHGVRTVEIPAKAAVHDPETGEVKYPAKDASSYMEAGVAVRGRFGDHVTETNTGSLSVVIGDDDPRPDPGESVDWLVVPYVRWVPGSGRRPPYPSVGLRFAGLADPAAAAAAPDLALASGSSRRR